MVTKGQLFGLAALIFIIVYVGSYGGTEALFSVYTAYGFLLAALYLLYRFLRKKIAS